MRTGNILCLQEIDFELAYCYVCVPLELTGGREEKEQRTQLAERSCGGILKEK